MYTESDVSCNIDIRESCIRATVSSLLAVSLSLQALQLYQLQEEIYSRQWTKEADPKRMLCITSVMLHIVAETLL
jgi:hypothetical protein